MSCLICNRTELIPCFPEYTYCTYCFHIQRINLSETIVKEKYSYNQESYKEFVLKKIKDIDWVDQKQVNVLVINDVNSFLIDSIYDTLSDKFQTYNIKTVSISTLYNNSFFSKHHHNKFILSEYTADILKNEHHHFDVIILNDTLTYSVNPYEILSSCKKLCIDTTTIISINYHACILSSMNLLTLDIHVNNIFNTNSMKTLCNRAKLKLVNVINYKELVISIIKGCEEINIDEVILDKLYDEITCNLYDNRIYSIFNKYWIKYLENINDIFDKYKTLGYKLIQVSNLPNDKTNFNMIYDGHIQITDIGNIDNIIKNMLERGDKKDTNQIETTDRNLLIILKYENSSNILDVIKTNSKKLWLYFDLYHLIAYNI